MKPNTAAGTTNAGQIHVRRFKPYPAYKDSGIRWVGKVPDEWAVQKLKHISDVNFSSVDKHSLDGEYPVLLCNYTDVYHNDYITPDKEYMKATATLSEIERFELRKGDVLVTKDSEEWSDIAVPANVTVDLDRVLCGYHLAHIRPHDDVFGGYLFRAFAARGINDQFRIEATGITRYGLGKYGLDNALFPVPPIETQRAIAAFLDHETARIDQFIAKKERQLELLQEKRSALISHAVTKGLNPKAKMKDSGIEWLGEIPEHWDVVRLGKIALSIQTGPFGSQLHASDYIENGIPVINPANIQDGTIIPDPKCTISEDIFALLSRHELKEGDIVFGRRGEMGRCALVTRESEGFLCGTGSLRLRVNTKVASPLFLSMFLGIGGVRDHLLLESVGSTMDNLNTGILARIPIAVPNINEQLAITQYVETEQQRIRNISTAIGRSIEKLHEYRTALISAAVTGKIDVREEVA